MQVWHIVISNYHRGSYYVVAQTWSQHLSSVLSQTASGGPHINLAHLSPAFSSLLVLFSQHLGPILSHLKKKKTTQNIFLHFACCSEGTPVVFLCFTSSSQKATRNLPCPPPSLIWNHHILASTLQKLLLKSCFNMPDTNLMDAFWFSWYLNPWEHWYSQEFLPFGHSPLLLSWHPPLSAWVDFTPS